MNRMNVLCPTLPFGVDVSERYRDGETECVSVDL